MEPMGPFALLLLALLPVQASPERASVRGDSAQLLDLVGDRGQPREVRLLALEQLAAGHGPLPLEQLRALQRSIPKSALASYVRCLGRSGEGALEDLQRYLRQRDPLVQAEAAFALVQLDHVHGEKLARQLLRDDERPVEVRVAALRGLSARRSLFARVEAIRRLATANGALLLEALDVLRNDPSEGDVEYLVDLLSERAGRAANEAVRLLQELTGYRMGLDPKSWRYWMRRHQVEGTPFRREPLAGEEEPATLSYMGIPVLGNKVVFVLDASGSMNTALPESYGETRGSRAVSELAQLLPRLPDDASFDVVFFNSGVRSFANRLMERDEPTLNRASRWLDARNFNGATNLYGGLEEAFEREGVEEIFVLSDGEPTAGEMIEADSILARVATWNRWRKIRVNAISFGAPARARSFLCRLASANDGICRVIQ